MVPIIAIALVCLVLYLAARRQAAVFNARDKSGDYRTTYQRLAPW